MHCKSYIPGYYTMRDINEETRNSWPMSYENNILNRHLYNGCLLSSSTGYSEYDKQMLKQTILEHEAIFRKQVYELHRLYGIQKDLMEGFQKNDLTRFSTCSIKPKNSLSSLEPQSQITRSLWQKSPQPALSSTKSRETTIDTNASISPISFFESNLQSSIGPWEIGSSVRDNESNVGLRTPTKRMLDLQFQTDVYINTEVTEHSQKEHIACSSSLTTAPYSRNYDGYPENDVKLTLSNVCIKNGRESGHKCYSDNKNNLFHGLSDLNETVKETPLEETNFSFPLQFFGPETQLDESYRIDGSLRSNNFLQLTSFSKSRDCAERDSSNILSTLKQELSQISLQIHREEEQFESNLISHSGKEKCMMAFESLQQSQIKVNEILLADNNKTDIEFMPKKGSSMDIPEKCFHKNGFNHGFDRDSCLSLQLDLSYSNMNLFSIKSSPFDIQNSESAPKNEVLSEMDEDCKVSPVLSWLKNKPSSNKFLNLNSLSSSIENEEEAEKRTIYIPSNLTCSEEIMQKNGLSMHAKIESNQVNELQRDSFFGGINISVVNSERSFRKHIDLNCEAQSIDGPSISQKPEPSVSLSASKALTLLHMDASHMAPEEDSIHDTFIKEAAEIMIKLSLDKVKPGDNRQSLLWFVDLALLNSESSSSEVARSSELDLFEQMTLQLEEMKPDDKTCCNPREDEKVKSCEKTRAILPLKKPRRGHARKRRQKRDFQKDTLPGLATLSRQEVVEDLQVIGGLMKATGYYWEVGTGRQNGGQNNAQVRPRRRSCPRKTTVKKQPNRNPKTLFEFDGPGMIGWGKTTRRCRRPRCPPAQTVTTALT